MLKMIGKKVSTTVNSQYFFLFFVKKLLLFIFQHTIIFIHLSDGQIFLINHSKFYKNNKTHLLI